MVKTVSKTDLDSEICVVLMIAKQILCVRGVIVVYFVLYLSNLDVERLDGSEPAAC